MDAGDNGDDYDDVCKCRVLVVILTVISSVDDYGMVMVMVIV